MEKYITFENPWSPISIDLQAEHCGLIKLTKIFLNIDGFETLEVWVTAMLKSGEHRRLVKIDNQGYGTANIVGSSFIIEIENIDGDISAIHDITCYYKKLN